MFHRATTLYLLAFPIALIGAVQMGFGLLSLAVFNDEIEGQFFTPATMMLIVAFGIFYTAKRFDISRIGFRDALLFAVLTWVLSGFLAAIPIVSITHVSFTDGVFEAISALTTTGATVLVGLDDMPKSFLLYRQFLQWLGGLGVVIFVVAVLPMLNIGGMKLLKAETPGPIKDDKLSPRIANTAHYMWVIYVFLTILCALSYYWAGMGAFDAIAHSFSTVATGGFSTHDGSMGYFKDPMILVVADVFMLSGAIGFALHFRAIRSKSLFSYLKDEESRAFLLIMILLSLSLTLILLMSKHYDDPVAALRDAFFHLISFMTSTGYSAASYADWPATAVFLLIFSAYLGGCAGSTAGGSKIIRVILSLKLIFNEIKRLVHPRGVFVLTYQGRTVESGVISSTMAFLTIVATTTFVLTFLLMTTGLDFLSAFTAVSNALNNTGVAFGVVSSNFQPVSDAGIWILSLGMILGRLEYFTVLVLFLPSFWRH